MASPDHPMARDSLKTGAWILAYLGLVSLPLIALLVGTVPGGLGFWWDLSMALGFAALGVMAVQFGLTARFRRAIAPFGMDIIYYFHRWMAVGGLGLLIAHWAILRLSAPAALGSAMPGEAPPYMTAGRAALTLFIVVVATSLWRKPLRLEYDRWRILHGILSVAAMMLAGWHIVGAGYYSAAPWSRVLLSAYVVSWVAVLGWVRLGKPWQMRRRPWRVSAIRREAGRSWTLTLEPDGHEGIRFLPGQFAWLHLARSPFRAREHPFSIASSAEAGPTLAFTIKELGDFTQTVGRTPVGTVAWLDGPHGVFTVDRYPDAPALGFVAGGVGIAPVMSMLRTLADREDGRSLRLLYANDRWDDVLFRDELGALAETLDLTTMHVIRCPPRSWEGETGLITPDVVRRWMPPNPEQAQYFLCGPAPMNAIVERSLERAGVPVTHIHTELFDMA